MKKRIITYILILLPIAFAIGIEARVKGLENNGEYMSLLEQEQSLKTREDSINNALRAIRARFSVQGEDRNVLSKSILQLEGDVFEVRNSLGIVASKIGDIEQNYVINNLDVAFGSSQPAAKPAIKHTHEVGNLVSNTYFSDNLSAADYAALVQGQKLESSVVNYIKIYSNNYGTIKELIKSYDETQNALAADSIYKKYDQLFRINRIIADSVGVIWEKIFDNKSYAYNYIFDKLSRSEQLAEFERRVRGSSDALSQEMMSPEIHRYAVLKPMLLDYEIKLAETLELTKAADSLKAAAKSFSAKDFDFPKTELQERSFITYEPLGAPLTTLYKASNPIPTLVVMPRGTVYRVLVGTYTRTQTPAIFKGLNPLYVQKNTGEVLYFAGGFQTLPEAEEALARIIKLGFKKAEVVVWNNGLYQNVSATADGTTDGNNSGDLYRVEIFGCGESLSDRIKDVISSTAGDKELSRVASNDSYIYIIGSFDNILAAQKLAGAIGGLQNGVTTKVIKITPQ